MLDNLSIYQHVAHHQKTKTLDKMMSERKHLVSTEVDKLIAATKGQPERCPRQVLALADVPAWLARVGGLRAAIITGGH